MTCPRLACDAERLYSERPLYASLAVFLHVAKTDGRRAEVIKVQLSLLCVAVKLMTLRWCNSVCLYVCLVSFSDHTLTLGLAPFSFFLSFLNRQICSHPLIEV